MSELSMKEYNRSYTRITRWGPWSEENLQIVLREFLSIMKYQIHHRFNTCDCWMLKGVDEERRKRRE